MASDDPVLAALYRKMGELSKPAAAVELTAVKVTPAKTTPLVVTVAEAGCDPCDRWEREALAKLVAEGWRAGKHYTIRRVPMGSELTPAFQWKGKAFAVEGYSPDGWNEWQACLREAMGLKAEGTTGAAGARGSARSAAAPVITTRVVMPAMPVVQQPVRGYVPRLSGPSWSEPNSSRQGMIQHLSSGQHGGKFPRAWLESLDYQSLQNLHDNDHNRHPPSASMGGGGYVRSAPVIRYMRQQPIVMRSGCPGGACPR